MATKPSGLPTISRVKTMPIRPIGITLTTRNRRLKLCSCAIRKNSMSSSITGTLAKTEACELALSSTVPPTAM